MRNILIGMQVLHTYLRILMYIHTVTYTYSVYIFTDLHTDVHICAHADLCVQMRIHTLMDWSLHAVCIGFQTIGFQKVGT